MEIILLQFRRPLEKPSVGPSNLHAASLCGAQALWASAQLQAHSRDLGKGVQGVFS